LDCAFIDDTEPDQIAGEHAIGLLRDNMAADDARMAVSAAADVASHDLPIVRHHPCRLLILINKPSRGRA
jgi:hypothetical protein